MRSSENIHWLQLRITSYLMMISSSGIPIALITSAILVRWLTAQFPHSGQSKPPMYGDYEAQRHWMEITTNLPTSEWYRNTTNNDLQYWGLDYPPLTAYHMYILGFISNKFFNSTWTELQTSRGIESDEHKLYMRATVLISDLFIYIPAIIYYFSKTQPTQYTTPPSTVHRHNIAIYTALVLFYPAQILIDHGHFQYNCVFMGLVLWAIIFMIKGNQYLSAICFCLALTYKQMALYYSQPFFWLIASLNLRTRPFWKGIRNVFFVGLLVLGTFSIVFLPFVKPVNLYMGVIERIFPFNRGLFEDKVGNFWFTLSVFYKYTKFYQPMDLVRAAALVTGLVALPSGIHLLFSPTIRTFKYALVTISLSFFLFSYHVHEKTILVPALPILLLVREHPIAVNWFTIVSTFSLQPLLIKDEQTIPYFVMISVYTLMSLEVFRNLIILDLKKILTLHNLTIVFHLSSVLGCFILSFLALLVEPPARLPHIHATANAVFSCIHFIGFLLYFYIREFKSGATTAGERVHLIKKKD